MATEPDKRLRWVPELLSCEGCAKELLFPLCKRALLETESKILVIDGQSSHIWSELCSVLQGFVARCRFGEGWVY